MAEIKISIFILLLIFYIIITVKIYGKYFNIYNCNINVINTNITCNITSSNISLYNNCNQCQTLDYTNEQILLSKEKIHHFFFLISLFTICILYILKNEIKDIILPNTEYILLNQQETEII